MTPKTRAALVGVLLVLLGGAGILAAGSPEVRQLLIAQQVEEITVAGLAGGEKSEFLANPDLRKILRERFGITIADKRSGSIRMVSEPPPPGTDFLWPSNEVASEIFREKYGAPRGEELIFNSPLVLLSWRPVVSALESKGMVTRREGVAYIDTVRLIQAVHAGTPWADVGLPQLTGRLSIISTDPAESNSGNMFAGLVATVLNKGQVPTQEEMETLAPGIRDFFARLGHLSRSSSDIFRQFLSTGMGAYPIIVAYENQLVEHYLGNPRDRDLIRAQVEVLYPTPTIWASHPLIALTPNGQRLAEALQDPEIQALAWSRHGFRTGVSGGSNDPRVIEIGGLPEQILSVVPMPRAAAIDTLITRLGTP